MKLNDLYPSRYLRAADVPAGREFNLTIRAIVFEAIQDGEEEKPILYFSNAKKGLVLNRTNAESVGRAYGDDTDLWTGCSVFVYATEVLFQGKMVPCLRIRCPRQSIKPEGVRQSLVKNSPVTDDVPAMPYDDIPF